MKKILLSLFFVIFTVNSYFFATEKQVYVININENINSKMWIWIQKGISQAEALNSDLIIIHMNTYGGELNFADSISTKILNTDITTIAFIDNNAASAGALISIACNKIYMRPGGRIGAATVVNGTDGQEMPDKYQSYMRGIMRATAESHGKDSVGRWVRDPIIAEAMVDPRTVGTIDDDSTKTLTFTTMEAIQYNYCEGQAENIEDIMQLENIDQFNITRFNPDFWDNTKGLLTGTILRGLLLALIMGGIWFTLQNPGNLLPITLAVVAAILYFAPLYIDGLAANWEILIFILGLVLIAIEIFLIPGIGVAGISGGILAFLGLTFSLLDNDMFNFERVPKLNISFALLTVALGFLIGTILMIYISSRFGSKGIMQRFALNTTLNKEDGFVGVLTEQKKLIGLKGNTVTDLRPSGKVEIEGKYYDASAKYGKYITKNSKIEVVDYTTGQIIVKEV